jgi:hypothetical protein
MHFKQEHIEDFKQLFESRKELIRNFEGCTYLELWQDEADSSIFYTYSIWKQPSDLESYRMSDLFQDTWSCIKKWFHDSPKAFSANKLIQLP